MTQQQQPSDAMAAQMLDAERKRQQLIKQKEDVRTTLLSYEGQIKQALPGMIKPDRMIRVALTAINRQPKLFQCTLSSIVGSVLAAAQLGLMPDGMVGEGYMIPFYNNRKQAYECQFMIGYKGYITLAYRSGMVESFQARAVYSSDTFRYEFGLNEVLYHVPSGKGGELTHVYAVIKLKGGGHVIDVMTREEVERVRAFSKTSDSTPWKEHYAEMAIKSVIRRIAKRCPLSAEFSQAVALEEKVEVLNESQNNSSLTLSVPADEDPLQLQEAVAEEIVKDDAEVGRENKEAIVASRVRKGNAATQQALEMTSEIKPNDKAGE